MFILLWLTEFNTCRYGRLGKSTNYNLRDSTTAVVHHECVTGRSRSILDLLELAATIPSSVSWVRRDRTEANSQLREVLLLMRIPRGISSQDYTAEKVKGKTCPRSALRMSTTPSAGP
ncbi:hypothetical protein PCASD_05378 [Puccinia coronata f. sp. avenae]|uniref:Uncharacterized protein n=1 Tax=Puccinia coronata f. sp. avenae TaxID=200324 RepID=A0A2N5UV93_9BASI|nr:hypothetical protein PCASD_05378 [Puccinia coronata f. sp. avenae]